MFSRISILFVCIVFLFGLVSSHDDEFLGDAGIADSEFDELDTGTEYDVMSVQGMRTDSEQVEDYDTNRQANDADAEWDTLEREELFEDDGEDGFDFEEEVKCLSAEEEDLEDDFYFGEDAVHVEGFDNDEDLDDEDSERFEDEDVENEDVGVKGLSVEDGNAVDIGLDDSVEDEEEWALERNQVNGEEDLKVEGQAFVGNAGDEWEYWEGEDENDWDEVERFDDEKPKSIEENNVDVDTLVSNFDQSNFDDVSEAGHVKSDVEVEGLAVLRKERNTEDATYEIESDGNESLDEAVHEEFTEKSATADGDESFLDEASIDQSQDYRMDEGVDDADEGSADEGVVEGQSVLLKESETEELSNDDEDLVDVSIDKLEALENEMEYLAEQYGSEHSEDESSVEGQSVLSKDGAVNDPYLVEIDEFGESTRPEMYADEKYNTENFGVKGQSVDDLNGDTFGHDEDLGVLFDDTLAMFDEL